MKAISRALTSTLLAVAATVVMSGAALAVPTFGVSGPGSIVSAGLHAFEITASDVSDLYGYQFSLAFDPSILQAASVTEGDFLSSAGATFFGPGVIDNTAGTISLIFGTLLAPMAGVTGSGVLANIEFLAIGPGRVELTLFDVLAVNSQIAEIPVELSSLSVSVPEPGTLILLAVALAAFASIKRSPATGMGMKSKLHKLA